MKKRNRLYTWLPLFLWMVLIYFFSTSTFSEDSTASIILPILRYLFPETSLDTLLMIHTFIRKMSHFTEFAVLSLLWLRTLRRECKGRPYPFLLLSFLLSTIYAIIDEFHQSFVSERSASYIDILIDSIGASSSLLFIKMFKKSETRE